ncbi:voltage-gated potassium channel [Daldinia vernicosa]|uniref:voltage-gated potassium channel n=1 Tax=Daldinia vernicosa TaxID=114800 RepID=UPI002007C149|nr:voltage-gated potassium channel [Daldinia vernicosa]KAI0849761.1 voltage-gated potassium channel [Daldinia vernicosa]
MEDAGLNNSIDEHSQAVDGLNHDEVGERGIKHDKIHLDPSRYWFMSAAFPMIAATLGPVASAFSICSLVKYWRQHIPPGSDVTKAEYVKDPPWLTAVNAVQLALAIVANMFLLLNMTRRVRFSIAQPITIVGWYISAICLIALCATASGPLELQPEIEYVWSQAFYYGLFAAVLYFLVASLMAVTAWGALTGHYGKDFELTTSQRTLMLQTILFLVYLLLGAFVFSKIEGWNYLDAIYWADVTLFTVGFGEISPQTTLGRGLLVPYALIGVISLGLVIGSIRSMILERGKHRLSARMLEKQRRQLIRRVKRKGHGDILEPIDDEASDQSPSNAPLTEFERRRKEFKLMRKVQRRALRKERWTAMTISLIVWLLLWVVGAKIFQECEYPYQGWSFFDGFYFSFTALTTIGYGDLTPVSNSAKPFFVFWSLLAVPTMTDLISNAGDTIVKGIEDGTLLLGNLTILPGDYGFKNEIKQLLSKLSCGMLFMDYDVEETPPGFLGAAHEQPKDDEDDDEEDEGRASNSTDINNAESNQRAQEDVEKGESPSSRKSLPTQRLDTNSNSPRRSVSVARESLPTELPKSRAEYHLVLIDEIIRVTKHLRHSPERKYTFKEWAWYLRLIGEDESSAEKHRRPEHQPPELRGPRSSTDDEDSNSTNENDGEEEASPAEKPWSWVGHRSPLLDPREEAEWILDRLEQKLREELEDVVRKESGKKKGRDKLRRVKEEERQNEEKEKKKTSGYH